MPKQVEKADILSPTHQKLGMVTKRIVSDLSKDSQGSGMTLLIAQLIPTFMRSIAKYPEDKLKQQMTLLAQLFARVASDKVAPEDL